MKQKGLKERAPSEVEQVSHLDEKLTQITTRTADALKRWRRIIIAIVIVGIAAYGIYFIAWSSRESRREYFNQEVYELFHSSAARKQGYKLDRGRLDKLLADVKGDPAEKMVLLEAVGWYLEYADRERKTQSIPGIPEAEGPISEGEAREARGEAVRIANEAAERNPDDTELQLWAATVKRRVEAEAARPWEKDRRRYVPPVIGDGGPAATPGTAAPATTPTPGSSGTTDAAKAPVTETSVIPGSKSEAPSAAPTVVPGAAPDPATAPAPIPDPAQPPAGAQPAGEKAEKASP